ncbi:carboxypeptidase-like regulatory domain-containing protein [Nonlabens sp.]|uniref:carboxypeptidase-like regulatory domain-containing protein n=1 Tax=Nonlabens sp. TaxID=1888209 RepID=UPI003F69B001
MKQYFFLLLFLLPVITLSQVDRVQIKGYIQNELDEPVAGITIFNENSFETTVTTSTGSYRIDVKAGDKVIFKSPEHEPVTLVVTDRTIKEKVVTITLGDGINVLDKIILEGDQNVYLNLKKLETADTRMEKITGQNMWTPAIDRTENTLSDMVRQPADYPLRHEAMMQSMPRGNMFNLVGLLVAVVANVALNALNIDFGSANTVEERFNVAVLKNQFDAAHLVEFLDIKEEDLYDFMYFATDRGLSNEMMHPDNEMELLQFLSDASQVYKERKKQ